MTQVRLLLKVKSVIENPPIVDCNCDLRIKCVGGTGNIIRKFVGDIITVGTRAECRAGTKDITQLVADGLIEQGWVESA